MFNSFGRNDPVTRRDVPAPVLGSAGSTTTRNATGNLASAQAARSPNPLTQAKATDNPSADQGVRPVAALATTASAVDAESAAGDKVIGARLIVGPDVKLKGAEILDCDTLVVEGRVEATMDSRVIRIAEKGSFSGKVSIDIAEIHGTFEGELTARSQLIIHATGRVSGSIRFGKLVVDEGGELCGEINVLSENVTTKARPVVEPLIARNVASA